MREEQTSDHELVTDAARPPGSLLFPACNAVVRLLAAAAVASMHVVPATTAWAQEAADVPKVISTDCFDILASDTDVALIKFKGGKLQSEIAGEPLVQLPTPCLTNVAISGGKPDDTGGVKPPPEEEYDAKAMRESLEELIKYLKAQGVPPENLTQPQHGVDNMIGRNEHRDDVRQPVWRASEEASKGDDATTAALLGLMTVGCVALTGGSACPLLPAIFGSLFKGKVTQEQIKGAARIANKIAKGQPLDDKDYDLLKDLGAEKWATKGLRALQTGKYEEFIAAVGNNNGISEDKLSLMKKLAKIAETGEITCAVLDGVIGSSITIDTKTRRAIDEIAFRSRKDVSANDRDELRKCLDLAFVGGS